MRDVLGMGEADCDIGISLYRNNIYRPRALVVALEVTPLSDQTRPQHPSPGSLQASLRGVRGPGHQHRLGDPAHHRVSSGRAAFQLNIRRSFLSSSC